MNLENEIIKEGAPTLAGIKTGNLFNYRFLDEKQLRDEIRLVNLMINSKGVYITALKRNSNSALLYIFRPQMLEKDLANPKVSHILKKYGYYDYKLGACIKHLKKRIEESSCFPHEIGLFLGYPTEDVEQFIEQKGCNFKCCGIWKVYCNEAESMRQFAKFKKCSRVYKEVFLRGRSITQLTVGA